VPPTAVTLASYSVASGKLQAVASSAARWWRRVAEVVAAAVVAAVPRRRPPVERLVGRDLRMKLATCASPHSETMTMTGYFDRRRDGDE
jgi:hypothetical protein